MAQSSTNPREIIAAYLGGKATSSQLLRAVMNHDQWHVPATEDDFLLFHTEDDEKVFLTFTDLDALEEYRKIAGVDVLGEHYFVVEGHQLFGGLDSDLSLVEINPESVGAVHYKQHQLEVLQRWARAVAVEKVLEDADQVNDPLAVLRDFDSYQVVLRETPDGHQLLLAPDDQGRRLAAVFTTDDALDLFLEQALPVLKFKPVPVAMPGERLFSELRSQARHLDGMVFNCSGPTRPRAYALAVADHILAEE